MCMTLCTEAEGGCIALYDVWRVWLYGCMAVWLYVLYVLYTLYILTGEPGRGEEAVYSQILYTELYGEVMCGPPRWTVFETFERLSPR